MSIPAKMASLEESPNTHININAKNEGTGKQYISDRSGDQNVATDSGMVLKIHHSNINIWHNLAVKGMPSQTHLLQSPLLNGTGESSQGPDRVPSRACKVT
ncbi:hypothetical protein F4775DRAFT_265285 [Biscogniauxia sp. FL1348]|nr:hypothetical protein F4775DRAFT_265285 [Biscogniauxia sp. FL1348]